MNALSHMAIHECTLHSMLMATRNTNKKTSLQCRSTRSVNRALPITSQYAIRVSAAAPWTLHEDAPDGYRFCASRRSMRRPPRRRAGRVPRFWAPRGAPGAPAAAPPRRRPGAPVGPLGAGFCGCVVRSVVAGPLVVEERGGGCLC